jgi:hypothetical protein
MAGLEKIVKYGVTPLNSGYPVQDGKTRILEKKSEEHEMDGAHHTGRLVLDQLL